MKPVVLISVAVGTGDILFPGQPFFLNGQERILLLRPGKHHLPIHPVRFSVRRDHEENTPGARLRINAVDTQAVHLESRGAVQQGIPYLVVPDPVFRSGQGGQIHIRQVVVRHLRAAVHILV